MYNWQAPKVHRNVIIFENKSILKCNKPICKRTLCILIMVRSSHNLGISVSSQNHVEQEDRFSVKIWKTRTTQTLNCFQSNIYNNDGIIFQERATLQRWKSYNNRNFSSVYVVISKNRLFGARLRWNFSQRKEFLWLRIISQQHSSLKSLNRLKRHTIPVMQQCHLSTISVMNAAFPTNCVHHGTFKPRFFLWSGIKAYSLGEQSTFYRLSENNHWKWDSRYNHSNL